MRGLAERPGLDVIARASVHFGLGKAFDDLGDYAEAMRQYDAANRLRGDVGAPGSRSAGREVRQHHCGLHPPKRLNARGNRWPSRRVRQTICRCSSSACPAPARRSSSRSCRRIPRSPPAANCLSGRIGSAAGDTSRIGSVEAGNAVQGRRRLSRPAPPHRPWGPAGDRQAAEEFRGARANPAGPPGCAHHSLPAEPGRYLPVDLLHQLRGAVTNMPGIAATWRSSIVSTSG